MTNKEMVKFCIFILLSDVIYHFIEKGLHYYGF